MTVPNYTNTSCPEQVDVTINSTTIQLDGITSYMRYQSTLNEDLEFSNAALTILELDYTPVGYPFVWLTKNGIDLTWGAHWTLSGSVITLLAPANEADDITVAYLSTSPGTVATSVEIGIESLWHDTASVPVPDGYLLCDGSAVSRTTYAALFAKIGTLYGVGDGTTTFNLPNRDFALYNGSLFYDTCIIKV